MTDPRPRTDSGGGGLVRYQDLLPWSFASALGSVASHLTSFFRWSVVILNVWPAYMAVPP